MEIVAPAELVAASDHVVLCAPLTPETRHAFDRRLLGRCRTGAHIVNVGPGALLEPDALRDALDGPLSRATLDVWEQEPPPPGHWVYTHPRVRLSAHVASRGRSTDLRMQAILEHNLDAWLGRRYEDMIGRISGATRYRGPPTGRAPAARCRRQPSSASSPSTPARNFSSVS